MKTAALLLSLLMASPWIAHAQGSASPTPTPSAGPTTYGAGHKLCSDWSAAETKADQSDYFANRFWVAGVMSAYNIYVSPPGFDIGKGLTPDDMKTWMHAECAAHPGETIATAAMGLIGMLKARHGR